MYIMSRAPPRSRLGELHALNRLSTTTESEKTSKGSRSFSRCSRETGTIRVLRVSLLKVPLPSYLTTEVLGEKSRNCSFQIGRHVVEALNRIEVDFACVGVSNPFPRRVKKSGAK